MKVRFLGDYDFNGEIIDGLLRREPSIDSISGFENVALSAGVRKWHTQQTQNLSPAFSVLFETLLSFLNPNRKTSARLCRRLQKSLFYDLILGALHASALE